MIRSTISEVKVIGQVFRWLGGKSIVFLALIAAILIHWSFKPWFEGYSELRRTAGALVSGQRDLVADATAEIDRSNTQAANVWALSHGQIGDRIASAQMRHAPVARTCRSDLGAMVSNGTEGVIANRKQCLRATLLMREIETLQAVRTSLDARRPGETSSRAVRRHARVMRRSAGINRDALAKLHALKVDYVPDVLQQRDQQRQRDRAANAARYYAAAKRNGRLLVATQREVAAASRKAGTALAEAHHAYQILVDERAKVLSANAVERIRAWAATNNVGGAMRLAAIALALIIAAPFLIRLFCYFVLAPLAMRRPAIQLGMVGGTGVAIPLADRSTTSVGVRLGPGEELLVRQDYLQTTSRTGTKGTQWFLDWRHMLTSFATGLTFLTRIRGDGEVTTVSAVRDPFAEVTIVTLPDGSSCVLHPRALAAVVQPIRRPLRVSTRWRLGSLNAWLTLQLRYVVFHGPARLVVKGGRGVRVERGERGRVFGQDQLVGFSADLSYSVTRTETFWPYLLGRETLLKDRVEAGEGVLIIEESPLTGRRGEVRRGIEGMIDAGMKVFGM